MDVTFKMAGEFEMQIGLLNFDGDIAAKIMQLITEAGKQFPCLKCPSKSECENFKWFLNWFEK
jgi:hypothetical protein